MDTRITLVAGWPEQQGTVYGLIYWYPIESPIPGIVPTPAATLPESIVHEATLPVGYAEALDAGVAAFELVRLLGPPGEPEGSYVSRFWDDYYWRYAAFRNAYTKRGGVKRAVTPTHTPTPIIPTGTPTPARTCEVCGSSLDRLRADARTCSNSCRQKVYRRKHAA